MEYHEGILLARTVAFRLVCILMADLALNHTIATQRQSLEHFFESATSFYQLGNYSKARAYFQKAYFSAPRGLVSLLPHSIRNTCKKNFELADQALRTGSQRETWAFKETTGTELEQLSDTLALDFAPDWSMGLGILCLLLYVARAIQIQRACNQWKDYLRRLFTQGIGLLATVFTGAWAVLFVLVAVGQTTRPAAVLSPIVVRSGPGERFLELARIPEGITVRHLDTNEFAGPPEEIWEQIRYSAEGIGWVRTANLLVF